MRGGSTRTARFGASPPSIWTIGHSDRTFPVFRECLEAFGIEVVVDVRSFPASRHVPWANRDLLAEALRGAGIAYAHERDLGGFRRPRPDSSNTALRSTGFRGYADHMASPVFRAALERLLALGGSRRVAAMCAEAVPWRCHRSFLADALLVRGARVVHILSPIGARDHRLSPLARVHAGTLSYPSAPGKRLKRPRP